MYWTLRDWRSWIVGGVIRASGWFNVNAQVRYCRLGFLVVVSHVSAHRHKATPIRMIKWILFGRWMICTAFQMPLWLRFTPGKNSVCSRTPLDRSSIRVSQSYLGTCKLWRSQTNQDVAGVATRASSRRTSLRRCSRSGNIGEVPCPSLGYDLSCDHACRMYLDKSLTQDQHWMVTLMIYGGQTDAYDYHMVRTAYFRSDRSNTPGLIADGF